ncbi:MAG: DUF2802 domain-containing protein [Woeseiaceae bacterium]|nr:DUF2802 domain-containing protein [Woeseiaceae bacterium]
MTISTSLYLLFALNALLLALVNFSVGRVRRQCQRLEKFWNSPTGQAMADDNDARRHRQLLVNLRLEKQLAELQSRLDALATSEQPAVAAAERPLPIDNAIRMAQNGASAKELTARCGLSSAEAQLMTRLHGNAGQPLSH